MATKLKEFDLAAGSMLTVEAAAQRLGLSKATIRAWIMRRKVAYVRLGRAIRIPSSEIARLLTVGFIPALCD